MALHVDANECKKKEKKEKKTYLEWEHADANVLRADGLACRWSCVQMVLHADGLACGWSCMWMVLRADGVACGWCCVRMVLCADGVVCGWCCMRMRCMGTWMVVAAEMVGTDECKEKTKKKVLTETRMDASLRMRCVWTRIVLDVAGGERR